MTIKRYIRKISMLSMIMLSVGIIYKSFAKNMELGESMKVDVVEEVIDDTQDTVILEEVIDDNQDTVISEEVIDDNQDTVISEEVIDDTQDTVILEEKEDVVEDEVELIERTLVEKDNKLPNLVGIDSIKKDLKTDLELPILPGFKLIDGKYTFDLKNMYNTVIKLYKDSKDESIILQVGSSLEQDEELQSIIRILEEYYKGYDWQYVYRGHSSYFKIKKILKG